VWAFLDVQISKQKPKSHEKSSQQLAIDSKEIEEDEMLDKEFKRINFNR
jgi:hypothetical protein